MTPIVPSTGAPAARSEPTERTERTVTAWLRLTRQGQPEPAAPGAQAASAAQPGDLAGVDSVVLGRVRGVVAWAMAALVLLIAGLAFVASFDKISTYAVNEVAWPKRLRWVPPLLVDSFTFVGTLLIVWIGLSGHPRRKALAYGWLLVGLGTAASVIVNLHHAPASLAGRIVAGSPPIALLLAVEALVLLLRYVLSDLTTENLNTDRPAAAGSPAASLQPVARAHGDVLRLPDASTDGSRSAPMGALASAPPAEAHPTRTDAQPDHTASPGAAIELSDDGISAQLRDRIEAIWALRERDGGERLVGAELARELGTKARHVQAVLRDLRPPGTRNGSRGGVPEGSDGRSV